MAKELLEPKIFCIETVLQCKNIQLSTWCQNGRNQLLALYITDEGSGELLLCRLTDQGPVLRRMPWFQDDVHKPTCLSFSPAASFLLVLSEACHLYTVPVMPVFDPAFKSDMALNATDISLISYPYKNAPVSRRSSSSWETSASPSVMKDLRGKRSEAVGSAVTWYQTLEECQQMGIVGTAAGDIFLVDLLTGVRIANISVQGAVSNLALCLDNSLDSILLLITTGSQQYELTLEQRIGWVPEKNKHRSGCSGDDSEEEPTKNYRGRLHGFKQMSVEKLQSIRLKIAEARARPVAKGPADDLASKPFILETPKLLDVLRDSTITKQYFRGRYVLTSYHPPSQLLTVHSSITETNPLFVHKMPPDSFHFLLSDRMIFVVTADRRRVFVVSSHLSESRIERDSEFDSDCIIDEFNLADVGDMAADSGETVLAIYKNCAVPIPVNVPDDWKVDGLQKMIEECDAVESCVVVTNRRLLRVRLSQHVMCAVLRLILDTRGLAQAERLCKVFGINLSKILELAGDIDLARLKIPAAIARFKLANCGPLRITVKLAKLGHCCELLSYCTALLMTVNANLTLTDHMHISNLLLMAFVHQILASFGAATHLKRKFLSFLETSDYYDKGLAMNVSAQSLLFTAVHKLMVARGLIHDGLAVMGSVVKSFSDDPNLQAAAQDDDLWTCLSEPALQEAFVQQPHVFRCVFDFIAGHLSQLSSRFLERLCRALDPAAPHLRPALRLPTAHDDDALSIPHLVHLFLTTLLVLNSRGHSSYDSSLMTPYENASEEASLPDTTPEEMCCEVTEEQVWPVRKERKVGAIDECESRLVSCGFGHAALIRNGGVYTWGLSHKGCLGRGPGLSRHGSPEPIPIFTQLRIQVSQVSCGRAHSLALTNNGVYAWGSCTLGQLGLGAGVLESPHPRLVSALSQNRVVQVHCGQYHSMFLTHSGELFGCGWNVHGQLGLGTIDNVLTPALIHTLKSHVITDVACGHGHTLVLTDRGHVYSFGSSLFGQLGHGSVLKSSLPVLVKGISAKVTKIATGYFHNLALTVHNKLYTWGVSPQVLRLQSQAHKRARAFNSFAGGGVEEARAAPVTASEAHLQPSSVDISNVNGVITQIACGCHHFALTAGSGSVYTWGRSMDGQLGTGARTEVILPSVIHSAGGGIELKAASIALGSDFTVMIEHQTGRVFAWGSNGSKQVGIPIKESAAKASDGKVIVVRAVKRVVRMPNSVANAVEAPVEVPGLPPASFTFQPLISCVSAPAPPPAPLNSRLWHSRLNAFTHLVNHDLLLCKCLEVGDHQAASKVLLLRGQYRQAAVHQLKALHKAQKEKVRRGGGRTGETEAGKLVRTPDTEMHPFTVQGGLEAMCDGSDNPPSNGLERSAVSCNGLGAQTSEYCTAALEILLRFMLYCPTEHTADILETGIQFWTAEKLPMNDLEGFLLEHLERLFCPLGSLLYLGKRELARHFSAELQLRVTSRLVAHVEENGSCEDFVAALSKLLSLGTTSVHDLRAKLQHPPHKAIHVSWPACPGDALYVFSCGHSSSRIVLPPDQKKLAEAYAKLDTEGTVDMACPDCVCSLLPPQVA